MKQGELFYLHHLAAFYSDSRLRPAEAVKFARQDLELRRTPETLVTAAWALHRAGQPEEAWALARQAFESPGSRDGFPHQQYQTSFIALQAGAGGRTDLPQTRGRVESGRGRVSCAPMKSLCCLLLGLTGALAAPLDAHPVAQGRMELDVQAEAVVLRVEVSDEEVSSARPWERERRPQPPAELWPATGLISWPTSSCRRVRRSWWARWLRSAAPEGRTAPSRDGFSPIRARYELRFPAARRALRPLRLEEDCLTESLSPRRQLDCELRPARALPGQAPRDGLLLESKHAAGIPLGSGRGPLHQHPPEISRAGSLLGPTISATASTTS